MSLITAFMMQLAEEAAQETATKGEKVANQCNNTIQSYEEIMESLEMEEIPQILPDNPTHL
jgi:DNA-binding protein H-NS